MSAPRTDQKWSARWAYVVCQSLHYTNQYFVLCGALKYFKWSALQKSLGTSDLNKQAKAEEGLRLIAFNIFSISRSKKNFIHFIFSFGVWRPLKRPYKTQYHFRYNPRRTFSSQDLCLFAKQAKPVMKLRRSKDRFIQGWFWFSFPRKELGQIRNVLEPNQC